MSLMYDKPHSFELASDPDNIHNFSLSTLELSESEIDSEILPQLMFLYQSNDLKLKEIVIIRLSEIQRSKSARNYLLELANIDESDYLNYLKNIAINKFSESEL